MNMPSVKPLPRSLAHGRKESSVEYLLRTCLYRNTLKNEPVGIVERKCTKVHHGCKLLDPELSYGHESAQGHLPSSIVCGFVRKPRLVYD